MKHPEAENTSHSAESQKYFWFCFFKTRTEFQRETEGNYLVTFTKVIMYGVFFYEATNHKSDKISRFSMNTPPYTNTKRSELLLIRSHMNRCSSLQPPWLRSVSKTCLVEEESHTVGHSEATSSAAHPKSLQKLCMSPPHPPSISIYFLFSCSTLFSAQGGQKVHLSYLYMQFRGDMLHTNG